MKSELPFSRASSASSAIVEQAASSAQLPISVVPKKLGLARGAAWKVSICDSIHGAFFAALCAVVLPRGVTVAPAARRAAAPRAALVTFEATRTVSSEPFAANEAKLKQWFGESDAVAALCSMADEFKELPSDQVEIVSRIPFPGMTAKSVTVLNVAKDLTAPTYTISTVSSETLCETGAAVVRKLRQSILGMTKSTSTTRSAWRSARRGQPEVEPVRSTSRASGRCRSARFKNRAAKPARCWTRRWPVLAKFREATGVRKRLA